VSKIKISEEEFLLFKRKTLAKALISICKGERPKCRLSILFTLINIGLLDKEFKATVKGRKVAECFEKIFSIIDSNKFYEVFSAKSTIEFILSLYIKYYVILEKYYGVFLYRRLYERLVSEGIVNRVRIKNGVYAVILSDKGESIAELIAEIISVIRGRPLQ